MTIRRVKHRVRYDSRGSSGRAARSDLDVDLDEVALAAVKELLQVGLSGTVIAPLFEALLDHGSRDLVWRGRGPGEGVEMRRAMSGLFGRFFARWYLTRHQQFAFFYPIDRSPAVVSRGLAILRRDAGHLPDWFCAGNHRIALAEAKGSYGTNVSSPQSAQPLRKAKEQLETAQVWMRDSGSLSMSMRSVKGWGVMSRWATEDNRCDPLLYALDPATEGEEVTDGARDGIIRDVARAHIGLLLEGMGLSQLSSKIFPTPSPEEVKSILSPLDIPFEEVEIRGPAARETRAPQLPAESTSVAIDGFSGRTFIGAVTDAAGAVIPETVSNIIAARATMPPGLLRSLYFVGLFRPLIEDAIREDAAGFPKVQEALKVPVGDGQTAMMDTDGFIRIPLAALSESRAYVVP